MIDLSSARSLGTIHIQLYKSQSSSKRAWAARCTVGTVELFLIYPQENKETSHVIRQEPQTFFFFEFCSFGELYELKRYHFCQSTWIWASWTLLIRVPSRRPSVHQSTQTKIQGKRALHWICACQKKSMKLLCYRYVYIPSLKLT